MRKVWYFLFHGFVKLTGVIPYLFCFKTKIYYQDKKAQSRRIKGKAIIISNHRSVWDVAVMMFVFFGRTLRTVIAEIMFRKNPFMRIFLRALGGIKVEREQHDFTFIDKGCKILEKNGVVEIYPEGRLPQKGEETPLPFKPSAGYMALLSGAPVIPVYTNGSYFRKERARVMIGKPVFVRDAYDDSLSEAENLEKINTLLREKIIQLQHELDRQTKQEQEQKK